MNLKGIRLLMIVLVLALIAAACGDSDSSDTTAAAPATTAAAPATTAADEPTPTTSGGGATSNAGAEVVVFMPPGTDTYLAEWQRGAREQGEALGFDVTIVENNFDQAEQDLQVQQALTTGELPDMFVWWPVDNAAGVASLKALSDSGVPVMQVNQLPVSQADGFWDLYAGVDDFLNGRVSGELLLELRDKMVAEGMELSAEGGNVLVVMFPAGYSAGADRLTGFQEATAGSGFNIIGQQEIGFDETSGYEAGLSLIPAHRDAGIDFVYAENDALASGMILALEEAGFTPGVDVGVVGGTCHGNLSDLEDGGQYATGLQAARLEGVQAMLTADLYFTNPTIEEGEYRAAADPDGIPPQDQLRTFNFIPNPAVYGSDIDTTSLWGFTMRELCTY
jgi:ribose transport system substrate-binding protein